MGLALVGLEWMAGARSHDVEPPGIIAVQGATSLAADSGAGAVADAAGKGGAAVIGHVPGAAALATELVRRGVHTMVYDVNACRPGEWDALERVAARSGVRLRCGSHLARFAPVMAGVRDYAEGHVSVAATVTVGPGEPGGPDGLAVCALASDVAMATFGEAPQAVFASAPGNPNSCEEDAGGEDGEDQVFARAPDGHDRGVANHTAAMMRFSGNRAALLSIGQRLFECDVAFYTPPDIACAEVVVSGHGDLLRRASLAEGSIDALWDGFGRGGMRVGCHGGTNEGEEGGHQEEADRDLTRYVQAMMAELETGDAPAWPPAEWSGAEGTVPDTPPWLRTRKTWKPGQPMNALPLPSSLAHVMEAILVSINTGAPVYLDQR